MPTPNLMAAGSLLPKILCSVQVAATTATAVYTVPANTAAVIKHGTLCNVSGGSVNVSVSVVPSGGTADGTHRVISVYPIAAGDTLALKEYLADCCMGPGDSVSVTASVGAAIDVVLTGTEST